MNYTQTKSTAMQTAARKRKLNTDEGNGNGNDKENLRPLFDLNYFFTKQQQDKNLPKE